MLHTETTAVHVPPIAANSVHNSLPAATFSYTYVHSNTLPISISKIGVLFISVIERKMIDKCVIHGVRILYICIIVSLNRMSCSIVIIAGQ